ncbi:MAG: folylpolyglutamate synthase/dihydrofolate synthase family protein [Sphingomonadales bacterium]|jgi:dihydrofolate synthase/folylpolyglutamate synthase
MSDVDKALKRLSQLHPKKIDLSLGRMRRVLKALGHPERKLPPVFHVAGTNGKGSTVAFLRAMLEAAGKSVHVYTSPHLVRFNERIRLNGKLVGDEELVSLLDEVEKAAADGPLTFFEATTAAAFLGFSKHPADALILEVGLGGRLDATNVVDNPVSTLITPISLDHQEFLGNNLGQIAREKAGIARENVPLIIGAQPKDIEKTLSLQAKTAGAFLIKSGTHWSIAYKKNADGDITGVQYKDARGTLDLPKPRLLGDHQWENAALAIAALRHQKAIEVPDSALKAGMGWAKWPARMQKLPADFPLYLDGGHNPAGAKMAAKAMQQMKPQIWAPVLILGMLKNKDVAGYLKAFKLSFSPRVIAVPIAGETCHDPQDIVKAAEHLGLKASAASGFEEALGRVTKDNHVLIAGSLYLAGQVLKHFEIEPD